MTQPTRPRPPQSSRRKRLEPQEIEARTRAVLILTLAGVLGVSVLALLYSLIFVFQPMEQSPNDKAFLDILQPLIFSIGGAMTGLAAGGAIAKRKPEDPEDEA
jgi:hypothetical protein